MAWNTLERPGIPWFWNRRQKTEVGGQRSENKARFLVCGLRGWSHPHGVRHAGEQEPRKAPTTRNSGGGLQQAGLTPGLAGPGPQPFCSLVVASSWGPVVSYCHHAEHSSTRKALGNGSEGNYGGAEIRGQRPRFWHVGSSLATERTLLPVLQLTAGRLAAW